MKNKIKNLIDNLIIEDPHEFKIISDSQPEFYKELDKIFLKIFELGCMHGELTPYAPKPKSFLLDEE